jgi:hypothetical protein
MSTSFFDRLEVELGGLTREGAHVAAEHGLRPRMARAIRRSAAVVALALTLAVSLDSEFAATANGSSPAGYSIVVDAS